MYLKKVDGPRAVRLPDGKVITRADLPPAHTQRWVASRKALVVRAVLYGLMSQAEAMSHYDLSEEEFFEWVHAVRAYGDDGLKVTQLRAIKHS
ncbi:DUF1153 domain-containing protein [uncultured Lentibacter sp.]|uniref:CtrA inhibitor SciP n=1 Tax=uncultured Lentibacter sp. TaxID=1659309 RepID=UPI0026079280|nr:DUF1153 domain-containing protein [uncultured Lentibacter sp.]MCW1955412.1 DUF1153 domain-containing protein [Roseobacter sp.]